MFTAGRFRDPIESFAFDKKVLPESLAQFNPVC